ncbi:MAG: Dabb family protein [Planctomycetia bacterium]|nr:Dabb family protein [Planctomycetia bacterium]
MRAVCLMFALLVVLAAMNSPSAAGDAAAKPAASGTPSAKVLRHVVLFKFKDTSTPADVERIVAAFRGLPARIAAIREFEWGTDVSPEGKAQGFTHCFLVTFANEADRDAYLPHPAHKEFVGVVGPHVDKVCVVDFWGQP